VRLDGLPLAIELAVPWMRIMSAEELATRLADRFSLLNDGAQDAPGRHRTLRATLDWSRRLLTEPERLLLERSSMLGDGWTLGLPKPSRQVRASIVERL
jgi:predicted ATPase